MNGMKQLCKIVPLLLLIIFIKNINAQTLTWNTATRTGTAPNYTYTGTGVSATVSTNAVTCGDGTPRVDGASGMGACYFIPSLALYAGFFNSYQSGTNSNITTTFNFANGYGCCTVRFNIKDINSDESFATFLDVIEISATYGNSGTAVPNANITTTLAPNVTRVNVGTTVKLVGHNSSSETNAGSYPTSYSSSPCNNTAILVTPPAGQPIKSITVKYRPAYGTGSSNAYYNSGTRPAAQYISFDNPVFTPTAGGCTPLPIELISFDGKCSSFNNRTFTWSTSSEKNNDYFTLEGANNTIDFENLMLISGAGNSNSIKNYSCDLKSSVYKYYRLKQTDFDGKYTYSDIISVTCSDTENKYAKITLYPNPATNNLMLNFGNAINSKIHISIKDLLGRNVKEMDYNADEITFLNVTLDELNKGVYFLILTDLTNNLEAPLLKFIKQ